MTMTQDAPQKLTRKDFQTDQEVRWCPGCGDYAILSTVQKVLPEIGVKREDVAIISGIGCSSRFPYYMNTYGFHTIHGRAPAIASGLKSSRPELSVWVITGDGDALSIGGNHLIHCIRRNMDVNILLFSNQIYGLTKGQYSPTSEVGKKTKSTPYGSIDAPLTPMMVAVGANPSFMARTIDREPKHMASVLKRAASFTGTSFIEIYQNCNIFNDGAFAHLTERAMKAETQLHLEHGAPLVFGADKDKGIVFEGFHPKVVNVSEVGIEALHVHDEQGPISYHAALADMKGPDFPTPLGIIRAIERPTYDAAINNQVEHVISQQGGGTLEDLLNSGETWEIQE